jgi:crotonobetainyl-CoA:carnitine CoA-transferase CaiB-like acyl-CoA transferase
VFEAMGGLTHVTGPADGEPMHAGYPLADNMGGLFGALGVMAALWRRARDPDAPGEEIDLALTEATLKLLEFCPSSTSSWALVRQRSGNANQYSAPAAVYRTQDGRWVSLAGSTNALFANNCRAIGRPDLVDDPLCQQRHRVQHAAELNALFGPGAPSGRWPRCWQAFDAAGGTIAPVYDIAQIEADPHLQARQAICDVPDADFGSVRMATVVPRFAHDPWRHPPQRRRHRAPQPTPSCHELRLTDTELAALRAAGVI